MLLYGVKSDKDLFQYLILPVDRQVTKWYDKSFYGFKIERTQRTQRTQRTLWELLWIENIIFF